MKKKLHRNTKSLGLSESQLRQNTQYMFSPYEERLLTILDTTGKTPSEMRKLSGIPHASMYLAFQKLCKRGFAKRSKSGTKVLWQKAESTKPVYVHESEETGYSSIIIHKTRDEIRDRILQVKDLPIGSKLYTIEGTQSASGDGWDSYFSSEETIELNNILSKRNIISESIIPKNYFDLHTPRLGKDWQKSYLDRPIITHLLDSQLLDSDTNLYASENFMLILHGREGLLLEIRNKEICKLFIQMFKVIAKK